MDRVTKIFSWIFFGLNLCLLICSVIGLYTAYNMPYYNSTRTIVVMLLNYILDLGVVILSFWAILKQSVLLLKVYALILLMAIIYDVLYNTVLPNYEEDIHKARIHIKHKWEEESTKPCAMGVIQQMYSCCGTNTPEDYKILERPLPYSCYSSKGVVHDKGCFLAIENQIARPVAAMVIYLLVQILLFAVVCYLIMRLTMSENQKNTATTKISNT